MVVEQPQSNQSAFSKGKVNYINMGILEYFSKAFEEREGISECFQVALFEYEQLLSKCPINYWFFKIINPLAEAVNQAAEVYHPPLSLRIKRTGAEALFVLPKRRREIFK